MREVIKCNFCGGDNFEKVYDLMKDRLHAATNQEFSVVKCKACSLLATTPALENEEDFKVYYPEHYYSYHLPEERSKKGKEKNMMDKIALFLYNLFYNEKQKTNPLRYLLFPFYFLVRGTRIKKGDKILDIGCGGGFFLKRMRDLGMIPYGIELGEQGFQSCKKNGIPAWKKQVFEIEGKDDFFDVITMNSVLEHIQDVKKTLKACHEMLRNDGMLIIQVPNADGFSAEYFKDKWAEWDIPRHLTHFTKKTLINCLKDAGFKIKKIKNTGSSFQFTQSMIYEYPHMKKIMEIYIISYIFLIPVFFTNMLNRPGRIEIYATKNNLKT